MRASKKNVAASERKLTAAEGDPEGKCTPEELLALQELDRSFVQTSLAIQDDGTSLKVAPKHKNELIGYALIAQALGTKDIEFLYGIIRQLANASSTGPSGDEASLNFMLSVIRGIKPRDQVESMLAAQMAAVHMATMTFARRLAGVENIAQQDSAERSFNKLTRTFAIQMEALVNYRARSAQKANSTKRDDSQPMVGNDCHSAGGETPRLTLQHAAPVQIDRVPLVGEHANVVVPAREHWRKA